MMNCVKSYLAPNIKSRRLSQQSKMQKRADVDRAEEGPLEERSCLSFCPAG